MRAPIRVSAFRAKTFCLTLCAKGAESSGRLRRGYLERGHSAGRSVVSRSGVMMVDRIVDKGIDRVPQATGGRPVEKSAALDQMSLADR